MDKEIYRSADWQENKLKELYYAFGTSEEEGLKLFLNLVYELRLNNPSFLERLYNAIEEIQQEGIYEVTKKTLDWVAFWKSYDPEDEAKNPIQLERLTTLKNADYLSQENLGRLYFELGFIESELKHHASAARHYEECLRLLPYWSWAYNNLGVVYDNLNRPDEALAALNKAFKLDPKDAAPHGNLGFLFLKEGKLERAKSHLEQAITLDENAYWAIINLGITYFHLKDRKNGQAQFQVALEKCPLDSVFGRLNKVTALMGLDQSEEALQLL